MFDWLDNVRRYAGGDLLARLTPADLVAVVRAQADAGVQHLIVNMPEVWDLRHLERIGRDVIPELPVQVAQLSA